MDFAPRKGAANKPAVRKPVATAQKPVVRKPVVAEKPVAERRIVAQRSVIMEAKEPALGVIEEIGEIEIEETKTPIEQKVKKPADKIFKMPKPQFINQDKIIKRPLSKNVYRKKVVAPKEEPKGPVTIITKPEKQAHVSLIITIILTIILGAAAGTVAFLLLPK